MAKLRILAFDGGYRPLVMCQLLARLVRERPTILNNVDVFSGTSSGSAVAALMASSVSLSKGLDHAIEVFRLWNPLEGTSPFSPRTMAATGGFGAFLTHELLYTEMRAALGETRINEIQHKLVIPTVELDNNVSLERLRHWSIQIYHNLADDLAYRNRLVDVVLRSSSIPILHPMYQGHADGGLFANNPSMSALVAAHDFLGASMDEVMIFSIGQGVTNHYMDLEHGDVGYQTWLLDQNDPMAFLNLVLDLNRQATVYHLSRLLEDRFVRLNPFLPTDAMPSPGKTAKQFAFEQELLAQDVQLDFTLEQLDEIGWFDAETGDDS